MCYDDVIDIHMIEQLVDYYGDNGVCMCGCAVLRVIIIMFVVGVCWFVVDVCS